MAEQKIALVTGGGTGIGKAISERLFRDGYTVISAGLENDHLDAISASVNASNKLVWKNTDLSDDNMRETLFTDIEKEFGRLDILVNNAAISGLKAGSPALDMSLDFFRNIMDVNLVCAFACAQSAANLMNKNKSCTIINISSVAASAAQLNATAYCASKAAIDAMTRSLAFEWAEYGIRVVGIAPGDIETKNSDQVKAETTPSLYTRKTPLSRAGLPAEIANTVSFLASDEASFITGETVRVDGGLLTY